MNYGTIRSQTQVNSTEYRSADQSMMPRPNVPNVPRGLEYLTQLDQVLIHQEVELLQVFTGWQCKNKFQIKNSLGQQVYYAAEESEDCMRLLCGNKRGFTMHILDNLGKEVFRATREFKCCTGCCWFAGCCFHCAHAITVSLPDGKILGYVRQTRSFWAVNLTIQDSNGEDVLNIEGPLCLVHCLCLGDDIEFEILSLDNVTKIGSLNKQWGGFVRETFTNASNFKAIFPLDLHVDTKATLLGAIFLLDYMLFENKKEGAVQSGLRLDI